MLQNEDTSSSIGKKRDRPRPKSLNLNTTNGSNSDLALRIVSPGLPPLTKEMQSTVVISKKIQQQQKHLIAARHSKNNTAVDEDKEDITRNNSDSEKSDTENDDNITKSSSTIEVRNNTGYNDKSGDETSTNSSINSNFDEIDSGSTTMSPKRLKREKIPSRLNISSFSGNMGSGYSSMPIIQSAPIRPSNKFPIPVNSNVQTRRRYATTPQYSITPNFQSSPYVMPVQRRPYVLVPLSQTYSPILGTHEELRYEKQRSSLSAISNNNKHQQSKNPSKADSKVTKGKQITVTDVYHGDYTKIAPLNSQPLSAQKDYFDKNSRSLDEDRSPVTDSEVKEMQEKYKGNAVNEHYANPVSDYSEEISGSINIMNENFNFKIFNQKPNVDDSTIGSNTNEYAKEKEKFIKICERTWDEFINKRKADSS